VSVQLRVLVVEDHPLFRKGVVALLEAVPDFAVAGVAVSGEEAVARAAELRPDVVLMDLQLPGMSGIEATRAIVGAQPDVRVLVLSLFEDEDSVFLALRAGARGYVLKDADEEELTGAIRAVARGEAASEPVDRPGAVPEPEDRGQLRVGDLREAAGGRPRGGDDPRPRGRPGDLTSQDVGTTSSGGSGQRGTTSSKGPVNAGFRFCRKAATPSAESGPSPSSTSARDSARCASHGEAAPSIDQRSCRAAATAAPLVLATICRASS
jgi:CheY-like chemotaxis protein